LRSSNQNDRIKHGYCGGNDLKIKGLIWFDDIIEKIKREHNVQILSARDMTKAERRLYEKT
jgi:uncharacterized DUF497 family protein